MKAHTTTKEFKFGSSLVGHRYDDIDISIRELQKALRDTNDPEKVWNYITSLFRTLKPE